MEVGDVKALLAAEFPNAQVDASTDGYHYEVTVIAEEFESLNAVKRQQAVYKALNAQIQDGTIHAVKIKALTPAEAGQ
ncbi:BolA family protein [Litoribacillus peritrichatus]|uniref:BolA family iron metabolism protein IbaG n=1 Tax=Litoribacillus peritrichatus TaxID=718191 RepID=A0ABP7NAW9_9GAMM